MYLYDKRQKQIPVWGDRRMPTEEMRWRQKVEKEWAMNDPTKEKVKIRLKDLFFLMSFSVLIFFILFKSV